MRARRTRHDSIFLFFVVFTATSYLAAQVQRDGSPAQGGKKKGAEEDPETRFVKENLKEFLSPEKIKFEDDGRIELSFDFERKNRLQDEAFNPRIRADRKANFRWSMPDEEYWSFDEGVRVNQKGMAFLRVWFEDDVEVEIEYVPFVNFSERQTMAVIFGSPRTALGSNFGSQAALFVGGRKKGAKGKTDPVALENKVKFKLVVKDGKFAAHKNGLKKEEAEYPKDRFSSGQVGLLWTGGAVSGLVTELEVKGTIDYQKTAKEMRAKRRRRR